MYNRSEQFNEAICGNRRKLLARVKFGDQEITEGFKSVKAVSRSCSSDYITIGGAVSSYVEIEVWKPDFDLENKEIEVSIGIELEGGTQFVPLGLFTVQKPKNNDGIMKFTAYDRITSRMSGAYFSKLTYPADGKAVLREISALTGVPVDVSNLPDGVMVPRRAVISEKGTDSAGNVVTNTTYEEPFNGYSYREALGYVAMLYCTFASADRAGTIVFHWYGQTDYVVGPDRYYDDHLVTAELVFRTQAISCKTQTETLTAGTGDKNIQLENPVMTQERLGIIHGRIKNFEYLPASLSFYGDVSPEIGDIVTVNDKYGNVIKLPVMSITQEFDGGLLTKIQSFGGVQEGNVAKGPTLQRLDRTYMELFLVKELVGSKASFEYVYSLDGEFKSLSADYGSYKTLVAGQLSATNGQITNLSGEYSNFKEQTTGRLTATDAEIENLKTTTLSLNNLIASKADIADLDAVNAKIDNLTAGTVTTDYLAANYASIDLANVETASVGELLARTGVLTDMTVVDGYVTGQLNGVRINADVITAGTLSVDRLLVTGEDSIVYQINVASSGLSMAELADEKYQKYLNGTDIVAASITGDRIAGNTITGNHILANSITGDCIVAKSLTSEQIDVDDLFAQNITATGTISGGKLDGAVIQGATGNFRGNISAESLQVVDRIEMYYGIVGMMPPGTELTDEVFDGAKVTVLEIGAGYELSSFSDLYVRAPSSIILSPGANGSVHALSRFIVHGDNVRKYAGDPKSYSILDAKNYTDYCLPLSGGTITGSLTVSGGLAIPTVGNMWIVGKTTTNCIYSSTQQTASHYYPMMRIDTASGHVWNIGGIGDSVGMHGWNQSMTSNGTTWDTVWDVGTGALTHTGNLFVNGYVQTSSIELSAQYPYIDFHFGKSTADYTSRIIENSSGNININGVDFRDSTIFSGSWFRSTGDTGWYSQQHGGGWWMTDSTWIRAYNDKGIFTKGTIYAENSFYVNTNTGLWCATTSHWVIRPYLNGTEDCIGCGNASQPLRLFTTSNRVWLHNTTTYFATTSGSDRRLKKDFSEITEAYERMYMDVGVSAFRYILDDDDLHYGFMAQDVEAALRRYGLSLDSNLYGISEAVNDEAAVIHDTNVYHVNYLEWVPLNKHMITKTIRRLDTVEAETTAKINLLACRADSTESRLAEATEELARLQAENQTIKAELEQLKQQRASAA